MRVLIAPPRLRAKRIKRWSHTVTSNKTILGIGKKQYEFVFVLIILRFGLSVFSQIFIPDNNPGSIITILCIYALFLINLDWYHILNMKITQQPVSHYWIPRSKRSWISCSWQTRDCVIASPTAVLLNVANMATGINVTLGLYPWCNFPPTIRFFVFLFFSRGVISLVQKNDLFPKTDDKEYIRKCFTEFFFLLL